QSAARIEESFGGLIDALYSNKKFAAAAHVCRELLELPTGDGKPRIYKVEIEDRFGDAVYVEDPTFDLTKKLQPGGHRLMIMGIAKDGRHDLALKLVDNLLRLKDHWQERQLRAWVLREAGKFAEAAKGYEDVIDRIDKDNALTQAGKDFYGDRY